VSEEAGPKKGLKGQKQERQKERGLQAINEGREQRLAGRFTQVTGRGWLVVAAGLIASLLVYRLVAGRELENRRTALLAKQRAVEATVGKDWAPLRDRLERFILDHGGPFDADRVEPEAHAWANHVATGVYLRTRLADTKSVDTIRTAAQDSARDAFTGCLLRTENTALAKGDGDAGAFPDQPWNLRQAYAATRILSPDWVTQVKEADDTLRLRIFEQQYDKAERDEIPKAIEIIKRADFFLLVLDESADDPADEKPLWTDGGVDTAEEAVQLAPHWARVFVLDLQKDKEILRLRRHAEAKFVFAGGRQVTDDETLDAMKRQVNNCALAQEVRSAVAPSQ
jgi:hypothetical protein